MVIIWLMMVNNHLVGGFQPTPLKNHGVNVSWDDDMPNIWKPDMVNGHSRIRLIGGTDSIYKAYVLGLCKGIYTQNTGLYGTVPPFEDPEIPIDLNTIFKWKVREWI